MATDIRINFSRHDCLGRPFGVEGVIRTMDRHGIEKAILVPAMAVDSDFRLGNKELFEAIRDNERLFGYLVVNPSYPEESIKLMRSAMASPKFLAVGFFAGASMPYPNLDDYKDILNAYRRFARPVFVHTPTGEAVSAAVEMAKAFPSLRFILGSMGGADWKRCIPHSRQLNILLETSGSFDSEKVEEAAEHFGAHRLLYGSNAPLSDPASEMALIRSSDLSDDAKEKILSGNALRWLGMGQPAGDVALEE